MNIRYWMQKVSCRVKAFLHPEQILMSEEWYHGHFVIRFGDEPADNPWFFLRRSPFRVLTDQASVVRFAAVSSDASATPVVVVLEFAFESARVGYARKLQSGEIRDVQRGQNIKAISLFCASLLSEDIPFITAGLSAEEEARYSTTHSKSNGAWCAKLPINVIQAAYAANKIR